MKEKEQNWGSGFPSRLEASDKIQRLLSFHYNFITPNQPIIKRCSHEWHYDIMGRFPNWGLRSSLFGQYISKFQSEPLKEPGVLCSENLIPLWTWEDLPGHGTEQRNFCVFFFFSFFSFWVFFGMLKFWHPKILARQYFGDTLVF